MGKKEKQEGAPKPQTLHSSPSVVSSHFLCISHSLGLDQALGLKHQAFQCPCLQGVLCQSSLLPVLSPCCPALWSSGHGSLPAPAPLGCQLQTVAATTMAWPDAVSILTIHPVGWLWGGASPVAMGGSGTLSTSCMDIVSCTVTSACTSGTFIHSFGKYLSICHVPGMVQV